VDDSVEATDCIDGDWVTRLIEGVRLRPSVTAVSSDSADRVDDLDIPLDPGMTVEEPDDEVDGALLDFVSNGFEVVVLLASLWSRIAGISLVRLGLEESLTAVSDRGRPKPKPEFSLSLSVSATDARRR